MKKRRVGIFLITGSMFFAMSWAWSIARDVAWEDMIILSNQIRELTYADSVLDLEVLRIRSRVVDHYDDVTQATDQLRHAAKKLQEKAEVLHLADNELAILDEHVKLKLNFVEKIKAENSVLRNSESYLPALLDEYSREQRTDHAALQSLLLRSLVLTDRKGNLHLKGQFQSLLPTQASVDLHSIRWRVGLHGIKSLEVRESIQSMLYAFLAIPVHDDITHLNQAFNQEQASREHKRERYRSVLYISAFGFFLSSIVILMRFVRLNRKTKSFVPFEMLNLLGKKTLLDIEYGTSIQKEMTVMFVDLRDFARTCEVHKPKESFAFVNEYLAAITPAVQMHAGFVAQFTGDGVMALFPGSPDDALFASVDMIRALSEVNQKRHERGEESLHLGIGINTSELMLGTIGHQNRMECTVLGSGVNIAARVEGLTRVYGCEVLLTEFTVQRLQKPDAFRLRNIDCVRPKGLQESLQIYELLDACDADMCQHKIGHSTAFQHARKLYGQRNFLAAKSAFSELGANDAVCRIYCQRCDELTKNPPAPDWDGVADFLSK